MDNIDWSKFQRLNPDEDNQLGNPDAAPLARGKVLGRENGEPDGKEIYLYQLWHTWDEKNLTFVQFISRNPENAAGDDLNTRKAIAFAKRWGYGGLCMTNLFALIGQPWACEGREESVGPFNVSNIVGVASQADLIVCCWGHNFERGAGEMCLMMLESYGHNKFYHLGLAPNGAPRHIGQVSKSAVPILLT